MRTTRRPVVLALALALLGAAASGCTVYRPEIRQGNFLDQTKIDQVKPGMTREQVQFLLGPPMLVDGFRRDRWDYIWTMSSALTQHQTVKRHLIVYFDGDRVREIKTVD